MNLLDYDDYRRFMADWFEAQKARSGIFSHRWFAQKAGFSSSSFCLSVSKGRFNLSPQSVEKLINAMALSPRDAEYFRALVDYNQAKEHAQQDSAWRRMLAIRTEKGFRSLSEGQQGYLSHWYYPVLRELASQKAVWEGDYRRLARTIEPNLPTETVRESVQKMIEWGILRQEPDGSLVFGDAMVDAKAIPSVALKQIRREFLERGIEAVDSRARSEHFAAFTTLSLGEREFQEALQILEEARTKLIALAAGNRIPDRVYELVVQLFPLSRRLGDKA